MDRAEAVKILEIQLDVTSVNTPSCIELHEALDIAIEALGDAESANTSTDLISRQAAIEVLSHVKDDEKWRGECIDNEIRLIQLLPPVEPKRPKGDVRLYIPLDEYTVDRVNRLLKNECGEYFDEEWLYNELEQLAVLYPERPKGKWVRHELWDMPWYTCSKCNFHGRNDYKFCPNCGADMRGDKE